MVDEPHNPVCSATIKAIQQCPSPRAEHGGRRAMTLGLYSLYTVPLKSHKAQLSQTDVGQEKKSYSSEHIKDKESKLSIKILLLATIVIMD